MAVAGSSSGSVTVAVTARDPPASGDAVIGVKTSGGGRAPLGLDHA